jgi:hypothetical protein
MSRAGVSMSPVLGGSGAKTLPAFVIAGAAWDAARNRLLAPGKSFALGQQVTLGGSTATNPSLLSWLQPPDPFCDSSSIFVTGSIDSASEPPQ